MYSYECEYDFAQAWNAISSAAPSRDGAHFEDMGVTIQRQCTCCNASCGQLPIAQLGSSSVWRQLGGALHQPGVPGSTANVPGNRRGVQKPTWLMAMGSSVASPPGGRKNCGDGGATETCSGIYFSQSTDLKTWTPLG